MKILTLLLCLHPFISFADVDIIYGKDNRQELILHNDPVIRELGRSTFAQIHSDLYVLQRNRDIKLKNFSLRDYGACEDEPFSAQQAVSDCTAFLISSTHVLTAGHCIDHQICAEGSYSWVLDYAVDKSGSLNNFIPKNKVYSCDSVVGRMKTKSGYDYAIIELDRAVSDRKPLKLNLDPTKKVVRGTELFVIGYPTGLPAKVADNAKVTRITFLEFFADLDTYGGNSGSPIFNAKTKEVEGILVNGNEDFIDSKKEKCFRSNRVNTPGDEGVFILSNIKDLGTYIK